MHPALAAYTSTCTSTFTHALSLIERVILQVPVQVPVSVWGPEGAQRGPAFIFDPRMHATTHLFSGRTHRCTVLARLGMRECRPSPLGLTHPMCCAGAIHARAHRSTQPLEWRGPELTRLNSTCAGQRPHAWHTGAAWAAAPTRCIMPYCMEEITEL